MKELEGGYRKTTNNRMDLMAAIKGLEALKGTRNVTVYSDSKYLVNAMNQGRAERWKANGWRRTNKDRILNPDLWQQLLCLSGMHNVVFEWVEGHSGIPDNERANQLAQDAASKDNLRQDTGYETSSAIQLLLAAARLTPNHLK